MPKSHVEGYETILLEEAEGSFIERPRVQGNHGYSQRPSVRLGCIQKQSANTLSARVGSDTDLMDVDQLVGELPGRLRAPDNFTHQVADGCPLIECQEGEMVGAAKYVLGVLLGKRVRSRRLEAPGMSIRVDLLNVRVQC